MALLLDFAVIPSERFGVVVLTNAGDAFDMTLSIMSLLLGEAEVVERIVPNNLPSASAVEGNFVMGRSMQADRNLLSGFTNAFPAMLNTVTAVDDNTIIFNSFIFGEATYQQTAPYVFEIVSHEGHDILSLGMHTLRFEMENGYPVRIHIGMGMDFIYVSEVDAIAFALFAVFGAISIGFLIIASIVTLIIFLMNRKKEDEITPFRKYSRYFIYAASALAIHVSVMVIRYFSGFLGGSLSRVGTAPHIWINYILAIATVALFAFAMIHRRKERKTLKRKSKVFFAFAWNLWLLLLFVMFELNFFILI